jgi:hypothetical protein
MTWEDVVALGRRLPEVEVATSYGTPALKVRRKLLTRLRREDDSLVLPGVGADERDMLIEADPRVFHTTPHYEGYPSVLARLGPLAPAQLSPFLLRRWRAIAPRRYVAGFDAAGSREGG